MGGKAQPSLTKKMHGTSTSPTGEENVIGVSPSKDQSLTERILHVSGSPSVTAQSRKGIAAEQQSLAQFYDNTAREHQSFSQQMQQETPIGQQSIAQQLQQLGAGGTGGTIRLQESIGGSIPTNLENNDRRFSQVQNLSPWSPMNNKFGDGPARRRTFSLNPRESLSMQLRAEESKTRASPFNIWFNVQ